MGITFGIIGPLNTYLRAGKLFPGACGCSYARVDGLTVAELTLLEACWVSSSQCVTAAQRMRDASDPQQNAVCCV